VLKTLTAILIFSIVWFLGVLMLGYFFAAEIIYPEHDLPLLFMDGVLVFTTGLLAKKWSRRK